MNKASRYGVNEAGKPLLPEFELIEVSTKLVNEDAVIDQIYDLKAHYEAEFVRLYKAMEAGGDIDHFKAMYFTHGVVVGLALAMGDSFDEAMGDSLRALLGDEEGESNE